MTRDVTEEGVSVGGDRCRYAFVTECEIGAEVARVFAALVEPEPWLARWRDVSHVRRLDPPDTSGSGGCLEGVVRAPLRYRLRGRVRTLRTTPPTCLRMRITGAIDGTARWTLQATERGTRVRLLLTARPRSLWLRVCTRVARPVLERGHHAVVRHGLDAVARELRAPLLWSRSRAAGRGRRGWG